MKNKLIRKDEKGVSPVIAVILMVAITVVLAGVLYAWVSGGIDPPEPPNRPVSVTVMEKNDLWLLEVVATSGGKLALEDIKMQIVDTSKTVYYNVNIGDANPKTVLKGESVIYPIPSGSSSVIDNTTGNPIDGNSDLEDYENCYIAYNDQNADGKISSGDTIWIYKDYNNDGTEDIKPKYKFQISIGNDIPLRVDL